MRNRDVFDVLIVYSDRIAKSASSEAISPFPTGYENYNTAYAYFLDTCREHDLKAALATTVDIIGAGECLRYWLYENNRWITVNKPCYSSFIFDKFCITHTLQKTKWDLLYSSASIQSFSNPSLLTIFNDKYETYKRLEHYSIPTVLIKSQTKQEVMLAITSLQTRMAQYSDDFSHDLILKDQYGFCGSNIYKIERDHEETISRILESNTDTSFVIQPFINFDKGYRYDGFTRPTDIRLIYLDGNIVQSFVRIAKENDFRCNVCLGATIKYISKQETPPAVIKMSEEIVNKLHAKHGFFSLDFIISNKNYVYLLEGNIYPGIDWYQSSKEDERMTKELIRTIVSNLEKRIEKDLPRRSFPLSQFFERIGLPL